MWLEILISLTTVTSFVGICTGIKYYKKLNYINKHLFFYLFAAFIADLLSRFLHATYNNTLILIPVFGFIELFIFSMIYNRLIFKNNRLFVLIIGLILAIIIIDIFTCNAYSPEKFQSFGRVLDGFTILFLSLYFYRDTLKNLNLNTKLIKLNTGVFLFFLLNSLWFLISNFLVKVNYKVMSYVWLINITTTPLFYSFLTFYIWKIGRSQKL